MPTIHTLSLFLAAYKHADGKKIDGKRVVVDVERGRTVKSWKPRRLGNGSISATLERMWQYVMAKFRNVTEDRTEQKGHSERMQ